MSYDPKVLNATETEKATAFEFLRSLAVGGRPGWRSAAIALEEWARLKETASATLPPAVAAEIEEALWALHSYESNRDDAGRSYSELEISKMVDAIRALYVSPPDPSVKCRRCGYERGAHFANSLRCPDGNGGYKQAVFSPGHADDIGGKS